MGRYNKETPTMTVTSFFPRDLFSPEHELFRDQVRRFVVEEVTPHHADWEEQQHVPRDLWLKAGENGFLGCQIPEEYGGLDAGLLYDLIVYEELNYAGHTGPGFWLQSSLVAPYLIHFGTEEQKQRWLPGMVTGELISGIAMTEPGAGSDLASIRTTAVKDGDDWVLNGAKTFISNGGQGDMFIIVAKTDPEQRAKGVSLFLCPADAEGFSRGRVLKKQGHHAQDTAELFMDNVRLPADALLGEENKGFFHMMEELPQERIIIAAFCVARAEAALHWTLEYTKDRKAFGGSVFDFQNTRFKLAEVKAELQVGRSYIDRLIAMHMEGKADLAQTAAAKMWCTEMLGRTADTCLQFFGGYGYMEEYPISKLWADARLERIYGGANEIMRELVARSL
ncbi:MAG: acyl-CoA dehydrogenase family protein [Alphaproteobacteria bacterium]